MLQKVHYDLHMFNTAHLIVTWNIRLSEHGFIISHRFFNVNTHV